MFDIEKTIMKLEAYVGCSVMGCDECKKFYKTNTCPCQNMRCVLVSILKVLYKVKDKTDNTLIDEDEIVNMFQREMK